MPEPHAALAAALEALENAHRLVAEAIVATSPRVPLKRAAYELGIAEEAALKRARRSVARGDGIAARVAGRWYFSRAYLDGQLAKPDTA